MMWIIGLGAVWFVVAVGGVAACAESGCDEASSYAKAVFWPIFLAIFLLKGAIDALSEAFN